MARRALLIGINDYKFVGGLNGCLNDLITAGNYLLSQRWRPDEIRVLTNDQATLFNVMRDLRWLVNGAEAGDILYLHLSGHGTQAPCSIEVENDQLVELFCLHDFNWDDYLLTSMSDKDFYAIFSQLPDGVQFNWFSDSCHSGDLTRSHACRSVAAPVHLQQAIQRIKARGIQSTRETKTLNVGFVSGCRSNQTSADAFFDGQYEGAATHYFYASLKQDHTEPMDTVVLKATQSLHNAGYDQKPQAEGTLINRMWLDSSPFPDVIDKLWLNENPLRKQACTWWKPWTWLMPSRQQKFLGRLQGIA